MRLFREVVRQGWTLRKVAEQSGISAPRLGELFWNLARPEPQELHSLVEALGRGGHHAKTDARHEPTPEQAPTSETDHTEATMLAEMAALREALLLMTKKDG
jgi:hypothetical protein